jgi:hypothetical protein
MAPAAERLQPELSNVTFSICVPVISNVEAKPFGRGCGWRDS